MGRHTGDKKPPYRVRGFFLGVTFRAKVCHFWGSTFGNYKDPQS